MSDSESVRRFQFRDRNGRELTFDVVVDGRTRGVLKMVGARRDDEGFEVTLAEALDIGVALFETMVMPEIRFQENLSERERAIVFVSAVLRSKLDAIRADVTQRLAGWKAHT